MQPSMFCDIYWNISGLNDDDFVAKMLEISTKFDANECLDISDNDPPVKLENQRSRHNKMDDPGEPENTDYNHLLKQIQNLSDLQSTGAIQNADPNLQVSN